MQYSIIDNPEFWDAIRQVLAIGGLAGVLSSSLFYAAVTRRDRRRQSNQRQIEASTNVTVQR